MMLTIAWNPFGFPSLDALLKAKTFNARCFHENILTATFPLHSQVEGRKLVIHADNAQPHTARKYGIFA
jgi:hypothetical protein